MAVSKNLEMGKLLRKCRSGGLLCGDCKILLAEKIKGFLLEHQKKREKAKNKIAEYLM